MSLTAARAATWGDGTASAEAGATSVTVSRSGVAAASSTTPCKPHTTRAERAADHGDIPYISDRTQGPALRRLPAL